MSHNYKIARRGGLKGRRDSRFGRRDTTPDDTPPPDGACDFYVGMTLTVTRPTFVPVDPANAGDVAVADKINGLPNPLVWTVVSVSDDGLTATARVTGHDRDVDGGVFDLYTVSTLLVRDESGAIPTVNFNDLGYPSIWAWPPAGYNSGLTLTVGPVPITACGVPFTTAWFASNDEVAVSTTNLICTVTLE